MPQLTQASGRTAPPVCVPGDWPRRHSGIAHRGSYETAATVAAPAVPAAARTRHRLRAERPALTVVIVLLHSLFSVSLGISRLLDSGIAVTGASHQNSLGRAVIPALWLAGMLVATRG
jgi:hypothetical protein